MMDVDNVVAARALLGLPLPPGAPPFVEEEAMRRLTEWVESPKSQKTESACNGFASEFREWTNKVRKCFDKDCRRCE